MAQRYEPQWSPDEALPGFEAAALRFPDDYDGPVYATLVRRHAPAASGRAVLYIHGYTDYFFQTHLADAFNERGYNFYALDLRKYGRSLRGGRHPNYCNDVREYFSEISASLRIIAENDGNERIVLCGHSTGGLVSALYADSGVERRRIDALVLNSPFFAFNLSPRMLRGVRALAAAAAAFPFAKLTGRRPVPYLQSIHADHRGEWAFNLEWRPLTGFPLYAGWLRAILRAHARVRRGLSIACPTLVMHAAVSARGADWHPGFQSGDGVLDVAHIRDGSRHLGPRAKTLEILDGLHDLVLSRAEVRGQVFAELFGWLDEVERGAVERGAAAG